MERNNKVTFSKMNRLQITCGHAQRVLTFDQKYEHESAHTARVFLHKTCASSN